MVQNSKALLTAVKDDKPLSEVTRLIVELGLLVDLNYKDEEVQLSSRGASFLYFRSRYKIIIS